MVARGDPGMIVRAHDVIVARCTAIRMCWGIVVVADALRSKVERVDGHEPPRQSANGTRPVARKVKHRDELFGTTRATSEKKSEKESKDTAAKQRKRKHWPNELDRTDAAVNNVAGEVI